MISQIDQQLKLSILQIYADKTANLKENDIFETTPSDKFVTKETLTKELAGIKYFRGGGGFLGIGNPQRKLNADDLNNLIAQGFYSVGDNIANNPVLEATETLGEEVTGAVESCC